MFNLLKKINLIKEVYLKPYQATENECAIYKPILRNILWWTDYTLLPLNSYYQTYPVSKTAFLPKYLAVQNAPLRHSGLHPISQPEATPPHLNK